MYFKMLSDAAVISTLKLHSLSMAFKLFWGLRMTDKHNKGVVINLLP